MKTHASKEHLYYIWSRMHELCENEKNPEYKNYGGKGISVCDDWNLYSKFCAWAWNNGYADDLMIDRKDENGNFAPDNCIWKINENIKYVEYDGKRLSIAEWSKITSVDQRYIAKRLARGWKPGEAIGVEEHKRKKGIGIRQRKSGWEYRFEAPHSNDGKRKQITKGGFPTKEEAEAAGKQKFYEIYNIKI